ncbi:hypothetical protein P308_09385 [Pseudomonas piscis]|nr:hypothetical protein P308_09385 [Pseudomonas piscis]
MLPPADQADGFFTTLATDLGLCLEGPTHRRPLRQAEQPTQVFDRKMQATFSSRLALGHSGNRGADGRGDAASATTFTAVHDEDFLATSKELDDAAQE